MVLDQMDESNAFARKNFLFQRNIFCHSVARFVWSLNSQKENIDNIG